MLVLGTCSLAQCHWTQALFICQQWKHRPVKKDLQVIWWLALSCFFFFMRVCLRGLLLQENNKFSEALHYYKLAIGSRPTLACKCTVSFFIDNFKPPQSWLCPGNCRLGRVCLCVSVCLALLQHYWINDSAWISGCFLKSHNVNT